MLFREIIPDDYFNGYMDLLFEFSNYKKHVTFDEFITYIHRRDLIRIFVAVDENCVVGAGTIFKLDKLHNNPVGQIEDVIITESYRGKSIGKQIVDNLVKIGLNEMKCYKVILNCLEKNKDFYEKCGFEQVGLEMRFMS
jgi:RimJ/RimL family protein N-acetyltransferase